MAEYHKYVFDPKRRKLVGAFEAMYRNESKELFDSWHQDDTRHLQRRIALALLQDYNFGTLVDLGCGKGAFTHLLKKKNNRVFALDDSRTALRIAKTRYPDIDFLRADLNSPRKLDLLLGRIGKKIDLASSFELFSYIKNWKNLLPVLAKRCEHILIGLYIPDNPIGFVKSENALVSEIEKYFVIVEWASLRRSKEILVFAKRLRPVIRRGASI